MSVRTTDFETLQWVWVFPRMQTFAGVRPFEIVQNRSFRGRGTDCGTGWAIAKYFAGPRSLAWIVRGRFAAIHSTETLVVDGLGYKNSTWLFMSWALSN